LCGFLLSCLSRLALSLVKNWRCSLATGGWRSRRRPLSLEGYGAASSSTRIQPKKSCSHQSWKMRLSDIPAGATVFVDANVPLASILEEQRAGVAEAFLLRMESREIVAATSTVVLGEMFHRLLLAETCNLLRVPSHIAVRHLKQQPSLFQQLRECWALVNEFLELPLTVFPVDQGVFVDALALSRKYQLLINDATHVALMAKQEIEFLATFDHDLERVDFVTCCGLD